MPRRPLTPSPAPSTPRPTAGGALPAELLAVIEALAAADARRDYAAARALRTATEATASG